MSQLSDLATPFPDNYIKTKPGRGGQDYVPHAVVTQRMLHVVGPHSFEVVEVVQPDPCQVLAKLTVTIDGTTVVVTEAGQSDNQSDPLKSAVSDAYKRCAMRVGLGLHLWAQDDYWLDRKLAEELELERVELEDRTHDVQGPY